MRKALQRNGRVSIETGETMTEQAHKKQCDMNYIVRDYAKTGLLKHVKQNAGRYDDVSVQDFQQAMFIVKNAKNLFDQLPSGTRKRFNNDPKEFLNFTQDPKNRDEMQKLGMLKGNDGKKIDGKPSGAAVETQTPSA